MRTHIVELRKTTKSVLTRFQSEPREPLGSSVSVAAAPTLFVFKRYEMKTIYENMSFKILRSNELNRRVNATNNKYEKHGRMQLRL